MSKIVYLCFNNKKLEEELTSDSSFELLQKRLIPDNITPNPVKIIRGNGIVTAIINPQRSNKIRKFSVCMGVLLKPFGEWYKPLTEIPDGNYALFRGDNDYIEVITDVVASRTIWYYFDRDMFITSTSQRAIVMLLRSFDLNKSAISWMLSSGTLGYEQSWDNRIKKLKGDSRVLLDRKLWKLDKYESPVIFNQEKWDENYALNHMREVYKDSFDRLDVNPGNWLMALSGGHDSRLVLTLLKDKINVSCVSWGYKSAIGEPQNDAYIAKELARHYNVDFQYYIVETNEDLIEPSLNRLLIGGEGRTDNVQAYMDGFHSWKTFFESDIDGIFRGDQGYISRGIVNEEQGRKIEKGRILSDYKEFSDIEKYGFPKQFVHNDLKKRKDESLIAYSYRLHHMYISYKAGAWTDIVSPFVEVINPLFSRSLIYEIRKLPDDLLYSKKIHRAVVESISSNIDFAKQSADEPLRRVLYNPHLVSYLYKELIENGNDSILPDGFLNFVFSNVHTYEISRSNIFKALPFHIKNYLKKMISAKNKQKMSAYIKGTMNYNEVALRCFIVQKMYDMLNEDADALNKQKSYREENFIN